MSTLNNYSALLVYKDANPTNNPSMVQDSWKRNILNLPVDNFLNQEFLIQPGGSQLIFSGNRTLTIDGTTTFSVSLNPSNANLYRFSVTGGTAAGFRTDRNLAFSGDTVVVTVNNNVSATFNLTTNNWSAVSVGDTLFIPNALTGDPAGPFSPLNGGLWTIIGKDSGGSPKNIVATRLPGQGFSGVSETVTLTANSQVDVFSSTGVQVGDFVELSAGFSAVTQAVGALQVYSVTSSRFEVLSTSPLALETGIQPGASGLVIYNNAKRFVRVESDQTCYVQFNGETSQTSRLVPPLGTGKITSSFGYVEKMGLAYSVNVVNKSPSNICRIIFISAQ